MSEVVLREISKVFDGGVEVLSDVDLVVNDGELMVFVGPSGCGKSTLLRIIAGLEEPTDGTIEIGGHDVTEASPAARNIAMVFQNYALYPHMTVRRNMELSLKLRHVPKAERAQMVDRAATMLGLGDLLDRRPSQLSGGQRQRVAMGRALVRNPSVFLLDEPLSNLDAKLRTQVRTEIRELQRRLGATMIFVTHDQVEAMTMADRVVIMRHGVIQQIGTPRELYETPANLFVADFIGAPAINLMLTSVGADADALTIQLADGSTRLLPGSSASVMASGRLKLGEPVIVGIRPESLRIERLRDGGDKMDLLPGTITLIEPLGGEMLVHVRVPARRPVTDELREIEEDLDDAPLTTLTSEDECRFVIKTATSDLYEIGQQIGLRLQDGASLHFFDPDNPDAGTLTIPGRAIETSLTDGGVR